MENNTLLSNEVIILYNYAETKKNVDLFMKKLDIILGYRLEKVLP